MDGNCIDDKGLIIKDLGSVEVCPSSKIASASAISL